MDLLFVVIQEISLRKCFVTDVTEDLSLGPVNDGVGAALLVLAPLLLDVPPAELLLVPAEHTPPTVRLQAVGTFSAGMSSCSLVIMIKRVFRTEVIWVRKILLLIFP